MLYEPYQFKTILLIVFPYGVELPKNAFVFLENSNEFDIYAGYINKDIYDQFNKESLNNKIPNENSPYKNNNINQTRTNFIRIPKVNENQYVYINIESNNLNILELISQKISEND